MNEGDVMQQISAAEWEVMRVVWASGDIKSSDIITILRKKYQWSDSTIKTLIGRLVEKRLWELTGKVGPIFIKLFWMRLCYKKKH